MGITSRLRTVEKHVCLYSLVAQCPLEAENYQDLEEGPCTKVQEPGF